MPASPHRLARTFLSLAAVVALVLPVALALTTGWIEVHYTPWGEQPIADPTPLENWVALALAYLVWAPLVFVGLVAAFDRLGHQYMPVDRDRRPTDVGPVSIDRGDHRVLHIRNLGDCKREQII